MGVAPMQCLLVQENDSLIDDAWTFFYTNIEGFDYEPGYVYKLKIKKEHLDPKLVPADASSIKYSLIEIISKTSDQRQQLHDIWALQQMTDLTIPITEAFSKRPVLELHLNDMKFVGNDGCNQIMGTIHTVDANGLKLGPVASTMMACPKMENSDKYRALLESIRTYKMESLHLFLYNENNELVLEFKKVD